MKTSRILLFSILIALWGCQERIVVTNEEFQAMASFKGVVMAIEQIPFDESESVPTAMTVDYRITIEKEDGTHLIIKRVSSIHGLAIKIPGTIKYNSLHNATLIVGKEYNFPEDLYKE